VNGAARRRRAHAALPSNGIAESAGAILPLTTRRRAAGATDGGNGVAAHEGFSGAVGLPRLPTIFKSMHLAGLLLVLPPAVWALPFDARADTTAATAWAMKQGWHCAFLAFGAEPDATATFDGWGGRIYTRGGALGGLRFSVCAFPLGAAPSALRATTSAAGILRVICWLTLVAAPYSVGQFCTVVPLHWQLGRLRAGAEAARMPRRGGGHAALLLRAALCACLVLSVLCVGCGWIWRGAARAGVRRACHLPSCRLSSAIGLLGATSH